MKRHFTILLAATITLAIFTIVTYTSCVSRCSKVNCINDGACNKGTCVCPSGYEGVYCEIKTDPCDNVTCQNGGSCANGICDCLTGYEGTYCEKLSRDKMIGTYTGTESCGNGSAGATYTIKAGTGDLEIIVNNGGNGFTATVTSKTTFSFAYTIPYYSISGAGTITGAGLTITTITVGGAGPPSGGPVTTTCTFTGQK